MGKPLVIRVGKIKTIAKLTDHGGLWWRGLTLNNLGWWAEFDPELTEWMELPE